MVFILIGCIGFLLYFIYDYNCVVLKNRLLNRFFLIGTLFVLLGTLGVIYTAWRTYFVVVLWPLLFAVFFAIGLVYTLFFALPFEKTYLNHEGTKMVYKQGVYALCRHPGVLWFVGLYLSLALMFRSPIVALMALVFSSLNVAYIVLQDLWTFPNQFFDYELYKRETPFLIPNVQSVRQCFQTVKNRSAL